MGGVNNKYMVLIIMENNIPANLLVLKVSEEDADDIRDGRQESEDVARAMADKEGRGCDEWMMCEDSELRIHIDKDYWQTIRTI